MSFISNLPPSVVAKQGRTEGESDEPQKKSREDYKKMKELEEARKAGTVPAMQDEDGNDINPHIPQYIMQVPWFFGEQRPTLKHQRPQPEKQKRFSDLQEWFKKGVKERPRKIGAKFTGDNFAPDEHLQSDLAFDYEGKRDRWNGYNPDEHQKIYEDFEKIEEAKRLLKEKKIEENFLDGSEKQVIEEEKVAGDSDDEDKYADDVDMPGQKFETKQRITVRNLRIREDTAKYLFNLDTSSAHYDPKTRSMREDPFKNTSKEKEAEFHGDNFVRYSGDAKQFAKNQMFAWDAYEHGADVHLQADPTKLALLSREEDYTEYSRHGTVIKGTEKPVVRSKYQEDVLINNHTSVWGSYWSAGHWGFKCCCSFIKESYCTGLAGIEAAQKQSLIPIEAVHSEGEEEEESQQKSLEEEHQERLKEKKKKKKQKKKNRKRKKKRRASSSESSSSSEESDADSEEEERRKQKKLAKALKKEAESQRRAEQLLAIDERKRPYNSMFEAKAPTEEEMEAWRMKRPRMEDPMTHFT
ncbi:SLU7-like protein [Mya arenaria]|uniref:Pre-mRNA-splicing factor SLU7 n=1 Tax=Mya arenaria TaxID=6604 RepID=A0ABY7FK69_MYAAR|nr:SLU7-like protein [Mya arenaria]WAR22606.1 SLU7-like protein [Mya arenaria]